MIVLLLILNCLFQGGASPPKWDCTKKCEPPGKNVTLLKAHDINERVLNCETPKLPNMLDAKGTVLVEVFVNETGEVACVRAMSGMKIIEGPALDAAKKWKFKPLIVDGTAKPYLSVTWLSPAASTQTLCWGIVLVAAACALATGAVSVPLALILLGITSLVWNLATALADLQSFGPAVRHGVAVSRAGMRKWAPLVITQMVLLGWVTFIQVSYTRSETKFGNTTYTNTELDAETTRTVTSTNTETSTQTRTTNTNWGVNSFWIGGYADGCKWHESLMKALEAKPVELVDTLLTMLFAVLAIVIKLRIVHDVYRPALAHDETPPFTQLNLTS
jgi:hypothetical protein